jgi:ring-1,2-phenylacetyl-CoA epoxidase subunit PaaE
MTLDSFFSIFSAAFAEYASGYILFVFPFFVIFWLFWKKRFQKIRIQPIAKATTWHFRHDLWHSFSSVLIFATIDTALVFVEKQGYSMLYYDVDRWGWPWLIASFLIALIFNDTYFYWTHRAMHHPRLYNIFHKIHHQSTDPSPLTSFAFHPSAAVVENLGNFLLPFIFPIHFGVVIAVQVFDMLNNVMAHLGYELYPKNWTKLPFLKYKTTSTHHNMHHELFDGNYALYFTWWDKMMGTEFPNYEKRHREVFDRETTVTVVPTMSIPATNTATVEVLMDGTTYQFTADDQSSMLDQALAQHIPLAFACKRGRCGTCKMQCLEGAVAMKDNRVLSEKEIEEGYVLMYQSYPLTPQIKIKGSS